MTSNFSVIDQSPELGIDFLQTKSVSFCVIPTDSVIGQSPIIGNYYTRWHDFLQSQKVWHFEILFESISRFCVCVSTFWVSRIRFLAFENNIWASRSYISAFRTSYIAFGNRFWVSKGQFVDLGCWFWGSACWNWTNRSRFSHWISETNLTSGSQVKVPGNRSRDSGKPVIMCHPFILTLTPAITGKKYRIISHFLLLKRIMSFLVNKYLILVIDL